MLLIGLLVGGVVGYAVPTFIAPADEESVTFPIGILAPMTGTFAYRGPDYRDSALVAVEYMNELLENASSHIRFQAFVEDSKGTGPDCLKALQTLYETQGVQIVAGPVSSAEGGAILSYATENQICVFPISSSPSLRLPDYLFRLFPHSGLQGEALAEVAYEAGIRKAVIIYRDDTWGVGYMEHFNKTWATYSGTSVGEIISIAPEQPDYSSEAVKLNSEVELMGVDNETAVIALFVPADAQTFLVSAVLQPSLDQVRWFVSDNWYTPDQLVPPKVPVEITEFIIRTEVLGTFFAPTDSEFTSEFLRRFDAKTGRGEPQGLGRYWFDFAFLGMLSLLSVGRNDGPAIAEAIPHVAMRYHGVTGHKILDENGDLVSQDFSIYTYTSDPTYAPIIIGLFKMDTKEIIWY
jgi:branched-chain amino acid transport system substrate-binding protein